MQDGTKDSYDPFEAFYDLELFTNFVDNSKVVHDISDFDIKLLARRTMNNQKKLGLLPRYKITEKDNQPFPDNKEVIVIEISAPDPREFMAAYTFAQMCIRTGYVQLGKNLIKKLFSDAETVAYVQADFILDMGPMPVPIAACLVQELNENGTWARYYIRLVTEDTFK